MKAAGVVVAVVVALGVGAVGREEPNLVPLLHGLASFVVPGFGQYLNGEYEKALVHFGVAVGIGVVGGYLAWAAPFPGYPLFWGVGLLYTGWALYSGWDAYTVALKREGLSLKVSPTGFALGF